MTEAGSCPPQGDREECNAADGPFSAAVTVAERLIKRVQVQGARQADSEADELYAAGRRAKGNAADGPFSAAVTVAERLIKRVQVQGSTPKL